MQMKSVQVVEADLSRTEHQEATLKLLDAYARDPMGNGAPLPAETRHRLIPGLRDHPTTMVFLAYCDDAPVGLAICFFGYSTFAARPLINIHDLVVSPHFRGQGVGRRLLDEIALKGQATGCCKLTLEVQENNVSARRVYERAGFTQAAFHAEAGAVLFMSKPL